MEQDSLSYQVRYLKTALEHHLLIDFITETLRPISSKSIDRPLCSECVLYSSALKLHIFRINLRVALIAMGLLAGSP